MFCLLQEEVCKVNRFSGVPLDDKCWSAFGHKRERASPASVLGHDAFVCRSRRMGRRRWRDLGSSPGARPATDARSEFRVLVVVIMLVKDSRTVD